MLWYKLCILVILLSDNVLGYWNYNPHEVVSMNSKRNRPKRRSTTLVPDIIYGQDSDEIIDTTEEFSSTTTEEITTTDEINTTEEPITTTEPPDMCNESLFTKNDLVEVFNHLVQTKLVHENITNSFHSEAESVRDKHSGNIAEFRKLFQAKPAHLNHILEEIRDTRHQLLPQVEDISKSLNQFPELQSQFEENQDSLKIIYKKFEKQKKFCEISCESDDFVQRDMILKRETPYDKHELYCGSVPEVHSKILFNLINHSETLKTMYKDKLEQDDDMYTTEIEVLKKKLKNIALKEFGSTMYDVLELQDAYNHFSDIIKTDDVKETLNAIKLTIAQMPPNMLTLQDAIQKLTKFCKACTDTDRFVSRKSDPTDEGNIRKKSSYVEYDSILDEVIDVQLQNLDRDIGLNYTSIFEDLVNTIEKANSTNEFIDDIKPIQEEVEAATQEENGELVKLKQMIPEETHRALLDLAKKSSDALNSINESIDFINDYIKQ